ncbi:MAG: PAS domain-containing protein, partial [Leptolinea sp.]
TVQGADDEPSVYRLVLSDITDRKQTEAALRVSEERYRLLANNVPDIIYTLDGEGNIVNINSSAFEHYGYYEPDLIGKPFMGFIHPDDRQIVYNSFVKAVEDQRKVTTGLQFRIIAENGLSYWFELNSKASFDRLGHYLGEDGVCRDITERKQTEEALKKEEQRLQNVITGTNAGRWEWNCQTGEAIIDENSAAILGYSLDQLQPFTFEKWMQFKHPDDQKVSDAHLNKLVQGEIDTYSLETRMKHKDGHWVWVLGRARVIEWDKDGKPLWIFGTHMDITENRRTEELLCEEEERLQEVLDNSLDASYKRNLHTNTYDYLSPVFTQISGYTVEEMNSLPIETVLGLMHPDDVAEINRTLATAMSDPTGRAYEFDYRFKHKAGQYRWLLDRFTVMRDADAHPIALIGSVSDITDRKKAEEALSETHRQLVSIIEGAQVGTWQWNLQTGETVYNDIYAEIVGYTLAELSPTTIKTWENLTHPVDSKKIDILLAQHLAGELPYFDFECRIKHKDGHWVWVQDRGRVMTYTTDGKPLMMYGTMIDISMRKQTEANLQESETRYRDLFNNSPIPTWVEDFSGVARLSAEIRAQGVTDMHSYFEQNPQQVVRCAELVKIVEINQASLNYYGVSSIEELELTLPGVFTEKSWPVFCEEITALVNGATTFNSEIINLNARKEERNLLLSLSVDPGHLKTLSRVLVSFLDITESKQAEEIIRESQNRLEEAQKIAHLGNYLFDIETNTNTWSKESLHILGLDENTPLLANEEYEQFIHGDDRVQDQAMWENSIRTGAIYDLTYRIIRPDGKIRFVHSIAHPQTNAAGKVMQLVGTIQDVTE